MHLYKNKKVFENTKTKVYNKLRFIRVKINR